MRMPSLRYNKSSRENRKIIFLLAQRQIFFDVNSEQRKFYWKCSYEMILIVFSILYKSISFGPQYE